MNTILDHLLFCLGEECGEIQQVAGKAGRFGLDDINPKTQESNLTEIRKEIHDLIAIYEMLCEECAIDGQIDVVLLAQKKQRVKQYMDYARNRGILERMEEHL